jgi:GH24 family phage-related lysozyme (muramidase)
MAAKRDPKSGRVLSQFESLAQENALAAAQYGQSSYESSLTAIEFNVKEDSSAVRSYIDRLMDLVRENSGSAADLQRILPLIAETVKVTKDDPSLSKGERDRIARTAEQIATQVRRKTALFTRVGAQLKGIVRSRGNQARERASEMLSGTDSAIGKLGAKLLSRRDKDMSTIEKSILSARGDLFQNVADRRAQATQDKENSRRNLKTPEFDEEGGAGGGGIGGVEQTRLLGNILDEVTDIHDLIKQQNERERQRDEQGERDADNTRRSDTSPTKVSKGKTEDKSILQTAWGKLGDMVGKFGGLAGLMALFSKSVTGVFKGVLSALRSCVGMFGRIATLAKETILSTFSFIKEAAASAFRSVLGILPDAAALLSPVVVAAAQVWIANSLGKVFNDIMDQYPMLKRGDKGIKEDVKAITDVKQNVGKVLQNTQDGKIITPKDGFESPGQFNARHKAGLSRKEFEAMPQSKRDEMIANVPQNLRSSTKGHDRNLPFQGAKATSPAPVPSVGQASLSSLPGQNVGMPTAPKKMTNIPTMPKNLGPERQAPMSMSDKGIAALRNREGLPPGEKEGGPFKAYFDKVGKVWTIGHGLTGTINGKKIGEGMIISAAEEMSEFKRRITKEFEPDVRSGLNGKHISQDMFDSLVSVSYNSGVKKAGYNLARRVSRGETLTADNFLASATAKNAAGESVRNHGLENRRMGEFRQASFGSEPSGSRSAAPLMAAASSGSGSGGNVTVISSPTVVGTSGRNAGQTTYVPVPIVAENTDDTLRALRSVGGL